MRSSKSRSRSKNNRNRSVGNIVNRVFDSSGPEGKVRGTPQQIIDKYLQLTRDAVLGNDRVAAENFKQHAEHYTRLLSDGMREMEAKREQQEREQRDRQERDQRDRQERDQRDRQERDRQRVREDQNTQQETQSQETQDRDSTPAAAPALAAAAAAPDPAKTEQPDIIEPAVAGDTGLVTTPEEVPQPKRREPRRRKPKETPAAGIDTDTPEAAAE